MFFLDREASRVSIPPLAAATFWIALILGLTAGFFIAVRKWAKRRERVETRSASQMMAEFREMRSRGELNDEEFQRIKDRLGPQLQAELSEAGGAVSVADAAEVLKQTARTLLSGYDGGAGERETTDAAGGAAQEGCDATPPANGDSTEERR